MKVHELAKEVRVASRHVTKVCEDMGIAIKSAQSNVPDEQVPVLKQTLELMLQLGQIDREKAKPKKKAAKKKAAKKKAAKKKAAKKKTAKKKAKKKGEAGDAAVAEAPEDAGEPATRGSACAGGLVDTCILCGV